MESLKGRPTGKKLFFLYIRIKSTTKRLKNEYFKKKLKKNYFF